jgi:hypothetical protein
MSSHIFFESVYGLFDSTYLVEEDVEKNNGQSNTFAISITLRVVPILFLRVSMGNSSDRLTLGLFAK